MLKISQVNWEHGVLRRELKSSWDPSYQVRVNSLRHLTVHPEHAHEAIWDCSISQKRELKLRDFKLLHQILLSIIQQTQNWLLQ